MLSFLLACAVLVAPFASNASWGYVQAAAAESDGEIDYSTEYVVLSLEGFTIGQGFYITPERMSYKEIGDVWKEEGVDIDLSKLTVSQATYAFFKKEGLKTEPSGTDKYNSSNFYLANIKGIDKGTANVPQELKDAYQRKNGKALQLDTKTGNDLGQFDYFSMSGWMNTVDNVLGNTGAGEYQVNAAEGVDNTHVIRWQFSLADYGADLGYGYNPDKGTFDSEYAYYETQDKTELYVLYAENAEEIAKDPELDKEIQSVMTDLTATADEVAEAESKIKGSKVEITMNSSAPYMTLTDAEGNKVQVGDPEDRKYTVELKPGTYRLSAYNMSNDVKTDMGSIDLVVTGDANQSYSIYSITEIACTGYDTIDGSKVYWKDGKDYSVTGKVMSPDNVDRHAEFVKTRESSDSEYAQYAGLFYYADMVSVTFDPLGDKADGYMSKTVSNTLTSNRSYGYSTTLAVAKTVEFTVPEGTELRVGTLSTYFIYKDEEGVEIESGDAGYDTYKYKLGSGITYYYRVTGGEGVTYWNWFSTKTDNAYKVSKEDMYIGSGSYGPGTIIHDLSANMYDVADIYMTSNEKGYISMQEGDTYSLECFRNWQAIEGIFNAKSAEPDYHYTVIDENGNPSDDVISVTADAHSEIAEIQAKSQGTAIVLVTYDAEINKLGMGGSFYSAIWPENTGVIVVTVGKDGTGIQTNMTLNAGKNTESNKAAVDNIDSQLDVLYYAEGTAGAEYTFAPETGVSVSVLRPQIVDNKLTYSGFSTQNIKKNSDGSYTVSGLVNGSNVIKVTKNGVSTYQVVRAKSVAVSCKYTNANGDEISADELAAGDTIEITYGKRTADGKKAYDGVYIPANKLAGVYNMYGAVTLFDGQGNKYSSKSTQYPFACTPAAQTVKVKIPEYFSGDEFTLTGCLTESGFGSAYGSHRDVRHATGKPVQMSAGTRLGYLGNVPEMSFKLAASDFTQVKLNVVDGITGKAVEGYDVTVTDQTGNQTEVTDGTFNGFAGRQYNYTIKCAGYMYKQGSFEIPEDTPSISKTIKLAPSGSTAWDGSSMSEPEQVDGVYQIGTGAELAWLANEVNVNKKGAINAALTADIDLAGYSWTPVGNFNSIYAGSFDGQGHTIKNLSQNDISYSGIFGLAKGTISNLTVAGNITMSTKTAAGAIVGYLYQGTADSPAKISNCVSKVDITYTGTNTSALIGGIAGYSNTGSLSNTVIENCVNYGTIKAENGGGVGGIIGSMISCNIYVKNSTNYGDITAKTNVGGILGNYNEYNPQRPACKIIACYNAGVVKGQTNVGGIAGYFKGNKSNNAEVEIKDCYSAGDVNCPSWSTKYVFAGYSQDMIVTDSVYSCAETEDDFMLDGTFVSPTYIEAVKKLTVDTVSKVDDAEKIREVGLVVKKMELAPLSDDDKAFVALYKELKAAIESAKTVTVAAYDYTAAAAGIDGATEDGVILEPVTVSAATATEAIEKALKGAGIDYEISDTGYGPYVTSVNGLKILPEYRMSGWMVSYNKDDFANYGLSTIILNDGDILELHYELTGPDVASTYSGLPTFDTLNVGGNVIKFTTDTAYDESYNTIYTYKANGEVLTGTGTKNDPFMLDVTLFAGADLTKTDVTYKTAADGHYVVVDGLSATMDLTNAVTCSITSTGGREAWYVISAKAEADKVLTEKNTKIEIADAVYTGAALKPDVTVYVSGNKLGADDYTVEYTGNVHAGTATCTVTGAGEFSGIVKKKFEIQKADQEITDVPKDQTVVLGETESIDVSAKAETGIVLKSDNSDVVRVAEYGKLVVAGIGSAKITLTAKEGDNYKESTAEFTVKVVGDVSKADCADIEDQTYTGKAITPEFTVTVAGKTLVNGTDYTVEYRNNTSVGTAKAVITGTGSYKGTKEVTFEIVKSSQTVTVSQTEIQVYEDAEPFYIEATGYGTLIFASSDTEVAEVNADTGLVTVKKPGSAEITVSSNGTPNYEAASVIVKLTVKEKDVPVQPIEKVTLTSANTVVKVADVTYTGKAQKPAVTVVVDGKKLAAGDYIATYSNNVNAGTAKVVIAGKGDYTGKVAKTFKIKKAAQTISGGTIYVYDRYTAVRVSAKGTVKYASTNKNIAVVDSRSGLVRTKQPGKVQIKVTASGNANYNAASGVFTLIIKPDRVTTTKVVAGKNSIKVTYNKVNGASGYQIVCSTDRKFKNTKSVFVSAKAGSATINKLSRNKKYYVIVRAYKTIGKTRYYGVNANTKAVVTKK